MAGTQRSCSSEDRMGICFVNHNAYGAITGGNSGAIGGIERQQTIMARWFAAKGYRVSMLTWDEGQPDGAEIDGVRVFGICRQDSGLRGLRFIHPRWTRLIRAMKRADAELYHYSMADCTAGQMALWCRCRGRGFVHSIASDMDCDPRLPELRHRRERLLYLYGLRHADTVTSQTRVQQNRLREVFRVDSIVIRTPCPGPSQREYRPRTFPDPASARILWVGRLVSVKRPHWFLDLAQSWPDGKFDMVGPTMDDGYSRDVFERGKRLPNVTMHGSVARDRMPEFYRQAAFLCSTSEFEGFPNTFLEAWSHGLPVVSTFDPDDLIATVGLGATAGDVQGLIAGIRQLLGSPKRYQQSSANARRYYLENHTVEAVMPQFERVFRDAVNGIRT